MGVYSCDNCDWECCDKHENGYIFTTVPIGEKSLRIERTQAPPCGKCDEYDDDTGESLCECMCKCSGTGDPSMEFYNYGTHVCPQCGYDHSP